MAAFTSKATGARSSVGATTWNEAGTRGSGDTVTINAGHTVTVDVDTTIGAGGGAGTTAVAMNGPVTIATGKIWTVKGDVIQGDVVFTMNPTSELVFDTTGGNRKWLQGTANSQAT